MNSFENYSMSWKPTLRKEELPCYLELAQQLEEDIKSGVLRPGTKLPPQRELADYLDVNLSTVTRSFKLCSQRGLITSSVGNGTYVSSDVAANHLLLHVPEARLIEMGAILPDRNGNQRVLQYIQKVIKEEHALDSMQYALPEGNARQRAAAAIWLQKAGVVVNDNCILLSNGGQNAIMAILSGIFAAGDTIGTNSVIYPGVKSAAKLLGIKMIPLAEERNTLTREGLIYACKNENMKGIYVIPDYSNPTTHTMDVKEREMIASVAQENHLIVIEDAINAHLATKVPASIASFAPKNTIHIASLSKIFSPGLRLAYIAVPVQYRDRLLNALYCMNISVSMLMVEAATKLIESGECELLANERRMAMVHRNLLVNEILGENQVYGDKECSFRWMLLPEEFSGRAFEMCAKGLGVQVYGSERFAVGGKPVQNAVRIAIPSASSDEEFERGLYLLRSILLEEDSKRFVY